MALRLALARQLAREARDAVRAVRGHHLHREAAVAVLVEAAAEAVAQV